MSLNPMIRDALSLEYKRNYGCALGKIELSDLVNYPPLASEFSRLGLSRYEEFLNLFFGNICSFSDDAADAPLISSKPVQHFP